MHREISSHCGPRSLGFGRPLARRILGAMILLATSAAVAADPGTPSDMIRIPAGDYRPLFVLQGETNLVPVRGFWLDRLPVTNADFLEFVRAHPRWRRSQVKRLFADTNYLSHWEADLQLAEPEDERRPVVWVSWFAAKAYAQWRGRRLPTVAEWEYAAGASPTRADGDQDPVFQQALRVWASTPSPARLSRVGASVPNYYGLQDLHGLIYEWTSDFNSAIVTGDARGDTGIERQLFCGAGSSGSRDPSNFPAFMRAGFRSSLKASYVVHHLGFRCAKDL